jgi:uncharacterized repeat protein (TIGR03803 family)
VDTTGKETVLHSFCAEAKCADGSYPEVGLTVDTADNLYGTTNEGGAHVHYGTVFEVNTAGNETVLYSFPGHADIGPVDPSSLIVDAADNLYGMTESGGTFGMGSVFTLKSGGRIRTLYSFNVNKTSADYPDGGLLLDPAGNLYGTAGGGNLNDCNGEGCGIVFELTP